MAAKKNKKRIKQQKNDTLDCMRGVACLFVVLIHCPIPGTAGEMLRNLGRFAVPFFVLISGYYWYKEDDAQRAHGTRKALLQMVKLTGVGTLFCAVANTAGSLVAGRAPFYWLTSVFSGQLIWEFLIFNRAAFLSSVMYYLFAMIYTYVLVLWLDRYHLLKCGLIATPILLVMNIVFCTVLRAPWYCAGNWLFTCVPFFFIGYLLRMKGRKLIDAKQGIWWGCCLAGIVITLVELHVFGDVFCSIGTVLLAVAVYVLCLKNPGIGHRRPQLVMWIRRLSVGVFLVHCTLRDVLNNLLGQDFTESYLCAPVVFVLSAVFVWCVWQLYSRILVKKSV